MYTPVEMDKVRNFRYGMKAVSFIENKFGKPIAKVDFENMTMKETATVILAGLIHEDKELTEEKVMDIIDEKGNLEEVLSAMGEAMQQLGGKNSKN